MEFLCLQHEKMVMDISNNHGTNYQCYNGIEMKLLSITLSILSTLFYECHDTLEFIFDFDSNTYFIFKCLKLREAR